MVTASEFNTAWTIDKQLQFVLHYATRAPSTHNSQPWLFRFSKNTLEIYADWSRKLPYGDKDGRDLCISLGACIEHAVLALNYFGMLEHIELDVHFSLEAKTPIARIRVHHSVGCDAQFAPTITAIEKRFNARGPFLSKHAPDEVLADVANLSEEGISMFISTSDSDIARFANITGEGMREAHRDPSFRKEISRWMISNYSKKRDGIPGYSMLAPGLVSLFLPALIGNFNMGGLLAKLNFKAIHSSSGISIFSSKDTPLNWVRVGMLFARMSLTLNIHDIFSSTYVASIETPALRDKLKNEFLLPDKPQFACTFGYPKFTFRKTPRLKLSKRMLQ